MKPRLKMLKKYILILAPHNLSDDYTFPKDIMLWRNILLSLNYQNFIKENRRAWHSQNFALNDVPLPADIAPPNSGSGN